MEIVRLAKLHQMQNVRCDAQVRYKQDRFGGVESQSGGYEVRERVGEAREGIDEARESQEREREIDALAPAE